MAVRRVRTTSGRYAKTVRTWRPVRASHEESLAERELTMRRAEDLVANDAHAASVVDTMALNVSGGCGLRPQAQIKHKVLGLDPEQVKEIQDQQEWAWQLWCAEAHVRGVAPFGALQYLAVRSMLGKGEYLYLVRQLQRPGRTFSTCLLDVHPARLCTPSDRKHDTALQDGVEQGPNGEALAHWIANPDRDEWLAGHMASSRFTRVPVFRGHRAQVLHGFDYKDEESTRGRSVLAPAAKLFRHLDDSLSYELIAQIVTASTPWFIATQNPADVQGGMGFSRERNEDGTEEQVHHQGVRPGQFLYGNTGERPYPLESNRPGNNFDAFAYLILRVMAASTGMPYEILAKDFSKTNYSSARAALLEAWRVFTRWRFWLEWSLCRRVWNLVQEEAFLLGLWSVPKGAPDIYLGGGLHPAWFGAKWIGPKRGYVDPVKEILANIKALDAGLVTYADLIAEQGEGWEETWDQRALEEAAKRERGLSFSTDVEVLEAVVASEGREQAAGKED